MGDAHNDPPITADKIDNDPEGDLTGDLEDDQANTIWDYAAENVPQIVLGGPAASLSTYPLAGGDIDYAAPLTTDANDNLALLLANGLTLNANGELAIPTDGSLSHGSEVDAPESVHHAKPTGTQSTQQTTGRSSGFKHPRLEPYGYGDVSETYWVPIYGRFKEIRVDNPYSSSKDVTVYYQNGGTDTRTIGGNSKEWVSVDGSRYMAGVGITSISVSITGANAISIAGHSHSI